MVMDGLLRYTVTMPATLRSAHGGVDDKNAGRNAGSDELRAQGIGLGDWKGLSLYLPKGLTVEGLL